MQVRFMLKELYERDISILECKYYRYEILKTVETTNSQISIDTTRQDIVIFLKELIFYIEKNCRRGKHSIP